MSATTTARHEEKGATRSAEDHSDGAGRSVFVCYACKHQQSFLSDCAGSACRGLLLGACPRCGERNA